MSKPADVEWNPNRKQWECVACRDELHSPPKCPPHLWIRNGSGAVCTECGAEITEIEKYAPFERHA